MIKFFSWASLLSIITLCCTLGHAIVSYILCNPTVYIASIAIFAAVIIFEFIRNIVNKYLANKDDSASFKADSIKE